LLLDNLKMHSSNISLDTATLPFLFFKRESVILVSSVRPQIAVGIPIEHEYSLPFKMVAHYERLLPDRKAEEVGRFSRNTFAGARKRRAPATIAATRAPFCGIAKGPADKTRALSATSWRRNARGARRLRTSWEMFRGLRGAAHALLREYGYLRNLAVFQRYVPQAGVV
jgi:hypothetical protein